MDVAKMLAALREQREKLNRLILAAEDYMKFSQPLKRAQDAHHTRKSPVL